MTDILILEDEESVNRGISFSLEKEGFCVRSCRTLGEARKALAQKYPDIVLCDVGLPDGNGLDFVSEVRSCGSAYIICLTAFEKETDQVMGYGAGADDYMTKPFSLSVLMLKIRVYLERSRGLRKKRLYSGTLIIDAEAMKVYSSDQEIVLTKNEWRLLCMLTEHPGRILSKRQILEHLFDSDGNFVNDNAVAVNINRLRDKIEPDRAAPAYIKNVRGLGYVWSQECRWGS